MMNLEPKIGSLIKRQKSANYHPSLIKFEAQVKKDIFNSKISKPEVLGGNKTAEPPPSLLINKAPQLGK